jgi:ribosomal protein S11
MSTIHRCILRTTSVDNNLNANLSSVSTTAKATLLSKPRQSKNNYFVTLASTIKPVIFGMLCGGIGLTGPKRGTVFAAEQLGTLLGLRPRELSSQRLDRVPIYIILKIPFQRHGMSLLRACYGNYSQFSAVIDQIARTHNGLRARKKRRL